MAWELLMWCFLAHPPFWSSSSPTTIKELRGRIRLVAWIHFLGESPTGGQRNMPSARKGEVSGEWGLARTLPSPSHRVRMRAASHYSSISICQASMADLTYVTWRPWSEMTLHFGQLQVRTGIYELQEAVTLATIWRPCPHDFFFHHFSFLFFFGWGRIRRGPYLVTLECTDFIFVHLVSYICWKPRTIATFLLLKFLLISVSSFAIKWGSGKCVFRASKLFLLVNSY